METWRGNWIPAPHYFNLNHACRLVNEALGSFGCYLVGSALRRRDFRDVDVRFIMGDDAYDRLFRVKAGNADSISTGYANPLWSLMCSSISEWLSKQSGLPVDFQIQRQTQANRDHSRKDGHQRAAIGLMFDMPEPEGVQSDG